MIRVVATTAPSSDQTSEFQHQFFLLSVLFPFQLTTFPILVLEQLFLVVYAMPQTFQFFLLFCHGDLLKLI
jgi:hypothetical protein